MRFQSVRGERGSVAAELALALPAVVLTLLLGAGALGAAARQVALQDATADAARVLGRGEPGATAAGIIGAAVPGASFSSTSDSQLVCVESHLTVSIARVLSIPLRASSCALSGGL